MIEFSETFSYAEMKALESCSLEELEHIILNHWLPSHAINEKLAIMLDIRKQKLNSSFKWGSEDIKQLIEIDQKLINCFEELKEKSEIIVKTLQKCIDEKDPFLHDFYIEGNITPYIYLPNEKGILSYPDDKIEDLLTYSINEYVVLNLPTIEKLDDLKEILHLDKTMDNSNDPYLGGKFENHYISDCIHDLYDHTYWSFPDILRINYLHTELRITQQNFKNI